MERTTDAAQLIAHANITSEFMHTITELYPFYSISTQTAQANSDTPTWRWTADGKFTTASTYCLLHHKGVCCVFQGTIWTMKLP